MLTLVTALTLSITRSSHILSRLHSASCLQKAYTFLTNCFFLFHDTDNGRKAKTRAIFDGIIRAPSNLWRPLGKVKCARHCTRKRMILSDVIPMTQHFYCRIPRFTFHTKKVNTEDSIFNNSFNQHRTLGTYSCLRRDT